MRAVYFDAFSGISGDMTLGALLHAGLPFDYLQTELAKLALNSSFSLEKREVRQHGITGLKLDVILAAEKEAHRSLAAIEAIISQSELNDQVKIWAIAIFQKLAQAEAKIHGVSPQQVHFHEVGAVDAIVDIVGSCIGFDYFNLEEFYCSPLPAGAGFVRSAHGLIPVPAPATLELLTQVGATFAPMLMLTGGIEYPARMEMVTPTGAAIVATLCRFERPAFKLERSGYGYGSKELPWPNALRLWLGETLAKTDQPQPQPEHNHNHHSNLNLDRNHSHPDHEHQLEPDHTHTHEHNYTPSLSNEPSKNGTETNTPNEISLLETNLDDMTPEGLGYLLEKLLAEGALDVYFTPIQMKKNRPATMLSVISRFEDEAKFATLILRESSSFGLRVSRMARYIAGREFGEVETSAGKVRVKRKIIDGELIESVPEYDSIVALAHQTGRPWREIYDEAKQASK